MASTGHRIADRRPNWSGCSAQLSALMTYRVAADVLAQMLPVDTGKSHDSLRRHTLQAGAALADCAAIKPGNAPAITVTLDSTFIRSCEDGARHLEVRVGNVGTESDGRQVFGAVAGAGTDIAALIRRSLDAVGRTDQSALTAFTDGCPGLRRILAEVGVSTPPILDWFHIAMRLQHVTQAASGLPADDPARAQAKAAARLARAPPAHRPASCGPPCSC